MKAVICPTVTAETEHDYQLQLETVMPFAKRIHIDLADGKFAPHKLIQPDHLWWPGNIQIDLHVMYKQPFAGLELFIVQHPHLVIVHAEAEGDFLSFARKLRQHGIKVGVALLPKTPVSLIAPALPLIDHVLIFSGNLGYQGGSEANLHLLAKVQQLKELKSSLEIGWDGGVNAGNVQQLVSKGIDVVNVGGYIQHAKSPARAYATLEALV